jgi:hypothetical protein
MSYGMHALYRSVRKSYPKIDFEIRFLSDRLLRYLVNPWPIIGEDTIPEGSLSYSVLSRVQPKQAIDFG